MRHGACLPISSGCGKSSTRTRLDQSSAGVSVPANGMSRKICRKKFQLIMARSGRHLKPHSLSFTICIKACQRTPPRKFLRSRGRRSTNINNPGHRACWSVDALVFRATNGIQASHLVAFRGRRLARESRQHEGRRGRYS
jgi:hypothetical protein